VLTNKTHASQRTVMPCFHRHVSVAVAVSVAQYVRITFIRKNSVACTLKITFSVSVSSPLPFIRSYRIEFYFSVPAVRTRLKLRPLFCAGNSAACLPGLPRYCRAHAPEATALTASTDTGFMETATATNTATGRWRWKSATRHDVVINRRSPSSWICEKAALWHGWWSGSHDR